MTVGNANRVGRTLKPLLLFAAAGFPLPADAIAASQEQLLCSSPGMFLGKVFYARAQPCADPQATSCGRAQTIVIMVQVKKVFPGSLIHLVNGDTAALYASALSSSPLLLSHGEYLHCHSMNGEICASESGLKLTDQEVKGAFVGKNFYFTYPFRANYQIVSTWLKTPDTALMWNKVCRTSSWHLRTLQ